MLNGAKVILISGPTDLPPPPNIKIIKVKTAKEMDKAVQNNLKSDVAIFTAAVVDFSPKKVTNVKIKKEDINNIILKKNPDIIKKASLNNNRPKLIIGFAVETNNHIINAKKKLIEKKCDLIVVNKISKKNNIFGSDYNKVTIISQNKINVLKKMTKIDVAKILVNKIINDFDLK